MTLSTQCLRQLGRGRGDITNSDNTRALTRKLQQQQASSKEASSQHTQVGPPPWTHLHNQATVRETSHIHGRRGELQQLRTGVLLAPKRQQVGVLFTIPATGQAEGVGVGGCVCASTPTHRHQMDCSHPPVGLLLHRLTEEPKGFGDWLRLDGPGSSSTSCLSWARVLQQGCLHVLAQGREVHAGGPRASSGPGLTTPISHVTTPK